MGNGQFTADDVAMVETDIEEMKSPECQHCKVVIHEGEGCWIDKDGFMACDPRLVKFLAYTHSPEVINAG